MFKIPIRNSDRIITDEQFDLAIRIAQELGLELDQMRGEIGKEKDHLEKFCINMDLVPGFDLLREIICFNHNAINPDNKYLLLFSLVQLVNALGKSTEDKDEFWHRVSQLIGRAKGQAKERIFLIDCRISGFSPDCFDLHKAIEVFGKFALFSSTQAALIRAWPSPFSSTIEEICLQLKSDQPNKDVIRSGWLLLSFIVGPKRSLLCPGLTAPINHRGE